MSSSHWKCFNYLFNVIKENFERRCPRDKDDWERRFLMKKLRNEVVGIFPFIKTFSGMRPPVRWKSWWIPRNEWWRRGEQKQATAPAEPISNISVVLWWVYQRNMVIGTNVYDLSLTSKVFLHGQEVKVKRSFWSSERKGVGLYIVCTLHLWEENVERERSEDILFGQL